MKGRLLKYFFEAYEYVLIVLGSVSKVWVLNLAQKCEMLNDEVGTLCFTSSTFSTNDYTLHRQKQLKHINTH